MTKLPNLQVIPKTKTDKKNAEAMSAVFDYVYQDIMENLATPFSRAIQAENMSYMLFGYIDPFYVKQKQDEFLQQYQEYIDKKVKNE